MSIEELHPAIPRRRPWRVKQSVTEPCGGQRMGLDCILMAVLILVAPGGSAGAEIFATGTQVPSSPGAPFLTGENADCMQRDLHSPVLLFDAIERALCESPKTRSAWAAIKVAAASLGIAKSAYLPTLDGEVKYAYQHNTTQVSGSPDLQSNYAKVINEEALTLGWVLYDFGGRSASVDNSRQLLLAAQSNQSATLQSVLGSTAKDYFSAQAANAKVNSKRRIEADAQDNLGAATARVAKGVAPVTDQLQANTAYAQAVYERAKAEGDCRTAIGALAVDMSLSPDEILNLPELDSGALPDTHFVKAVHELLEDAKQTHPKVLAAAARWQAAVANIRFTRARGLPIVRLVGESDRSNQPVSASLGEPELPALTRENYIGLKIEIPLFDGFNRDYQIREAQAQADVQEQALRDTQQQVAVGVWSSVQTLQSDTENLRNSDVLLQSARDGFDAAQHRYRSGVGNILEVLSAQSALSSATQEWIEAHLEWRIARLNLAASLGTLGMWVTE